MYHLKAMNILPILVGLIALIVIIVALYLAFTHGGSGTAIFNNPDCTASLSDVPNISGLPCCYVNGNVTPFRYVQRYDAVVAPVPVYYLDACSGFCENASYDKNTMECITGSSTKFQECISISKPRNCNGSAMPVAALDTELFYIKSATVSGCPCDGACDGSADC